MVIYLTKLRNNLVEDVTGERKIRLFHERSIVFKGNASLVTSIVILRALSRDNISFVIKETRAGKMA